MENQKFESLTLCPLDGRYSGIKDALGEYFSEYALVKYRVFVEIQWLKFLIENIDSDILRKFDKKDMNKIESISNDFNYDSFKAIKDIEATTRHDVKAVEYFIGNALKTMGYDYLISFVHIGCTSEDINNTSYACMLKYGLKDVWVPKAKEFADVINQWAVNHRDDAMLAHTHGQPATPTTIGKEFKVYAYRLASSIENIENIQIKAKFNGATGNYSAILTAFPNVDWQVMAKKFVEEYLGLTFNPLTTQIESHDYTCHILDGIRHFNNVLVDFDVDMWLYISMEYFKQIPVKGEVGSSTMPHKVNPIRFENSEANVDMSNHICIALSNKLPKSRMQRDLSDSSSQRNLGLAFGYSLQAINETMNGLAKCVVNKDKLASDLNEKWEVLAEPIQTMLRKYGVPDAYDTLKALTRGKNISKEDIIEIRNKELLKEITSIFTEHKGRYGVRRVHQELINRGYKVNHKRVQRLMHNIGLFGKRPKEKYHSYKGNVGKVADNIINRDFKATAPLQKWTTDVSQFNFSWGKCYLSPILDMYTNEIISYDLSLHPNLKQICNMLDKAYAKFPVLKGLIFHSDQGWQYQMEGYHKFLSKKGIIQSMSRKGNCLDNLPIENFLWKNEMFYGNKYTYQS